MRFASFFGMLEHWSGVAPDAPALIHEENGEKRAVSYAQLLAAVRDRAEVLKSCAGRCEAILADGSYDCVVEVFAAVDAGLPVALLDANAPDEALTEQLNACDAGLVWGDEDLCEELGFAATGRTEAQLGDVLFFTSGTTHRAKAVVLTEQSLCSSAYNGGALLPLAPSDTLMCMLPLSHVFGFVCGLLWGLSCGACVALGRGARHYADDLAFFEPTALSAVPLLLGFLVQRDLLNPSLKLILVGAGDCPPLLLALAAAKGIRVSFGYGLTETSSGVALSLEDDPYAMTVCPDDQIRIAEDGEILLYAPTCVMKGYYKNSGATAEVLKDGWLHTGDLGLLDGRGKLHITGRKKDMLVFSDGTKLFLPEAEAQLSALLPGVDLALAQEKEKVVLHVYAQNGATEAEIMNTIKPWQQAHDRSQQIARAALHESPLPRTATGKVKRWKL